MGRCDKRATSKDDCTAVLSFPVSGVERVDRHVHIPFFWILGSTVVWRGCIISRPECRSQGVRKTLMTGVRVRHLEPQHVRSLPGRVLQGTAAMRVCSGAPDFGTL